MQREEYLISVTIHEARGLVSDHGGPINPFVRITVNDRTQITSIQNKMNDVTWNQQFTFTEVKMNKYEIEIFEMILEVNDCQGFYGNQPIGEYSIGLSTLFRSPNHELHKTWLRLYKKDTPTFCIGYLQVSCFIVGQNELPPVHENNDAIFGESDEDEEQEITRIEKIDKQRANQGLRVISAPKADMRTYQLIVKIYKADGLPNWTKDQKVNAFISVRSQGCHSQTISIVNENQNWNQKLCFPVYWPTYNDKVTIRMWHDNMVNRNYLAYLGLSESETFLAHMPELPSSTDIFNITELIPLEGRMDSRWINLYGVRPEHRNKVADFRDMPTSSFMGRVLISITLVEEKRPQFKVDTLPGSSEPKSSIYQLQVDVFDIQNCEELFTNVKAQKQKNLYIQVKLGGSEEKTSRRAKREEESKCFTWKDEKCWIDPIEVQLPDNDDQKADLFVYLLLSENPEPDQILPEDYIGFIRIPAKDFLPDKESKQNKTQNLKWRNITAIESGKKTIGILLMNISWEKMKERGQIIQKQRMRKNNAEKNNFIFYAQIISGYEILPNCLEENVETHVLITINQGGQKKKEEIRKTDDVKGRFPLYKYFPQPENIIITKSLEFIPNMVVQLFQKTQESWIQQEQKWISRGQFLVPVESIQKKIKQPQFFSFLDNEGNIVGKVLA